MSRRSEDIKDLAKALSAAQGKIVFAEKSAENPFFHKQYADLASVIKVAKAPLEENGLAVVQTLQYTEAGALVLNTELLHSSGQWISGIYPVNPVKNDPQGLGSAVTYARRYAYQALLGIAPAGEDDDGNRASGKETPPAKDAARKKPEPPPPQAPPASGKIGADIPENPWLWKIQGDSFHKNCYVAALTDDVLKKLKNEKTRESLHLQGRLTGHDMEALYECFRNLDARPDALTVIMDEEAAKTEPAIMDQTNE